MGDRVYLDGSASLRFWRWYRTTEPQLEVAPHKTKGLVRCTDSISGIDSMLEEFDEIVAKTATAPQVSDNLSPSASAFGPKLDNIVPTASLRCQSSRISSRVQASPIVSGTFYQVTDSIFVLSPEAAFERISRILPLSRRILLAMELCGTYALSTEDLTYRYDVVPVSSAQALLDYCERLPHSNGSQTAGLIRALRWVVDNSASLMETVVVVLLVLPYRHGGYGLALPSMNIPLDSDGRVVPQRTQGSRKADVSWFDHKVALEYNSREFHCGLDDYERDSDRREWFERLGFKVIPVSAAKLYDAVQFNELAHQIAELIGCRLRLPEGFERKSAALRSQILPRRQSHAHARRGRQIQS